MKWAICLSVIILVVFAVEFIKAKECVTPYGENATCLPISKCDVISSVFFTFTAQAIEFVKDSKCGCDNDMVCCGTSNNKIYPKLIDCVPVEQPKRIKLFSASDPSTCGLDSLTDRIVGGTTLKAGEFPWLAALEYKNKDTGETAGIRCGGSLITSKFVLTAAHCIVTQEFEINRVWLGVTNLTTEETCYIHDGKDQCVKSVQKYNVVHATPHELYRRTNKYNDIGLLELDDYIELTDYVRPICIPSADSESPNIGTRLTVAGWGVTENGTTSKVKLKVDLPLRENKICQDFLRKHYRNITTQQLCVGGESGKDSCEGDSGGPLMYDFAGVNGEKQWFQQGIVSYGASRCGAPGKPGIYVKVSEYTDWMLHHMKIGFHYRNAKNIRK